jgi:hypothetical protein
VRISVNPSAIRQVKSIELVSRFLLGGAITAAAGFIGNVCGPTVGGLFLAFPAILPASLTLVAKQQERRKAQLGLSGIRRGRQAAALDAFGALIGTAGLAGFAITIWFASSTIAAPLTLVTAMTVWLGIAIGLWRLRES